jgi:hypothetical protein
MGHGAGDIQGCRVWFGTLHKGNEHLVEEGWMAVLSTDKEIEIFSHVVFACADLFGNHFF